MEAMSQGHRYAVRFMRTYSVRNCIVPMERRTKRVLDLHLTDNSARQAHVETSKDRLGVNILKKD